MLEDNNPSVISKSRIHPRNFLWSPICRLLLKDFAVRRSDRIVIYRILGDRDGILEKGFLGRKGLSRSGDGMGGSGGVDDGPQLGVIEIFIVNGGERDGRSRRRGHVRN